MGGMESGLRKGRHILHETIEKMGGVVVKKTSSDSNSMLCEKVGRN